MKTEKIVWGLTLVFVGTILLLDNFGIINFYWRSVWHFWPLILVLVGLNLVFGAKKSTPTGTLAMILVTCLVLGFVAYVGINRTGTSRWSWYFNGDDHEPEHHSDATSVNFFSENYTPGINRAELHISGGATNYQIKDTTSQLFDAEVKQTFGQYTLSKTSRDSVEVLKFKMQDKKSNWNLDEVDANQALIQLNSRPIWDIYLEMGAGTVDFDLSPYKISKLNIEGGAASFDVKLGRPLSQTEVSVETGVAAVKLAVPKDVACRIKVKSGLSSKDFKGFEKQGDGSYITPNFQTSASKIIINLEGGLSDFEVKRY